MVIGNISMVRIILFSVFIAAAFGCSELSFGGNFTSECVNDTWYINGDVYVKYNAYGYAWVNNDVIINGTLFNFHPAVLALGDDRKLTIYGDLVSTGFIQPYRSRKEPVIRIFGNASWRGDNQTTASLILYRNRSGPRYYYVACVIGTTNDPHVVDYGGKSSTIRRVDYQDINCNGTILYYKFKDILTKEERTARILNIIALAFEGICFVFFVSFLIYCAYSSRIVTCIKSYTRSDNYVRQYDQHNTL